MKSVVFHGVLAALGLVLAYSVWAHKDEPERAAESVTLFECTPERLRGLQLDAERQVGAFNQRFAVRNNLRARLLVCCVSYRRAVAGFMADKNFVALGDQRLDAIVC